MQRSTSNKHCNGTLSSFAFLFSASSSSCLLLLLPSEERLRGELGLLLLKREAGGGPRVLREHRLALSDLLCESADCFVHPRVVLPLESCDAEGCHSLLF